MMQMSELLYGMELMLQEKHIEYFLTEQYPHYLFFYLAHYWDRIFFLFLPLALGIFTATTPHP